MSWSSEAEERSERVEQMIAQTEERRKRRREGPMEKIPAELIPLALS